jgi:hypothetical protein
VVIGNGDNEIHIARKSRLGSHGDSQSTHQGPGLAPFMKQRRNLS